jgi:hypothetical protein
MYLLDAAGASILILLPIAFVLLLFVWGLVEGFIINLFRINGFWRSVWHAVLVNLVSLAAGFLMITLAKGSDYEDYFFLEGNVEYLPAWGIYLAVSFVLESFVLKALNRSVPWSRIFTASLIMNILTYIFMYGLLYYNN